ncbi:MAG: hypothetical protein U0414_20730 [Polyangiaceae bacterium]
MSVTRGELYVSAMERREIGSWYNPTYAWAAADFGAGAPYTGWYRVSLTVPKSDGPTPVIRWSTTR